jgi:hypothetical protein
MSRIFRLAIELGWILTGHVLHANFAEEDKFNIVKIKVLEILLEFSITEEWLLIAL